MLISLLDTFVWSEEDTWPSVKYIGRVCLNMRDFDRLGRDGRGELCTVMGVIFYCYMLYWIVL